MLLFDLMSYRWPAILDLRGFIDIGLVASRAFDSVYYSAVLAGEWFLYIWV